MPEGVCYALQAEGIGLKGIYWFNCSWFQELHQ